MPAPIAKPIPENIKAAANVLRAGGMVAMPTETVYGLACDASNPAAVARLFNAKGRPAFNPLIAHINGPDMGMKEAKFSDIAGETANQFWPGPLTLVLPLAFTHSVCDLARSGLGTVGLRYPSHQVAIDLITAFGGPLVAPSANPSGKMSPTRARHIREEMGDKVDLILDGGACEHGVESTIISFTGKDPALLRAGALAAEDIEEFLGETLTRPRLDPNAPTSPGQMLRHYAPNAALRLNAYRPEEGEAWLGFGPKMYGTGLNLSPSGDLVEAAARLFAALRALDDRYDKIAVAPIPMEGLGEAINDRLERAANS